MNKVYIVIMVVFLLIGGREANAQTPYNDGEELASGTVINTKNWYVDEGATVHALGKLVMKQQGSVNGILNVAGDFEGVTLSVSGTLTIQGKYAKNDWKGLTICNGGLVEVFGDFNSSQQITIEAGGKLIVHGKFTQNHSLTIDGVVEVDKEVYCKEEIKVGEVAILSIGEGLKTDNKLTVDGSVEVGGNVQAKQEIKVGEGADLGVGGSLKTTDSKLTIEGDVEVGGNVQAKQEIKVGEGADLDVEGSLETTDSKLTIEGDVEVGGSVQAKQEIEVGEGADLGVEGSLETTDSKLTIEGDVEVGGSVQAKQEIKVGEGAELNVEGGLKTTDSKLSIEGDVEVGGSVQAKQEIKVGEGAGLTVEGGLKTTDSKLTIDGDVEVGGSIQAKQEIEVGEGAGLTVEGDLKTTDSKLTVNGDVVVGGNLSSKGDVNVSSGTGNLVVVEDLNAGGDVKVDGNKNADFTDSVYEINGDKVDGAGDVKDLIANESLDLLEKLDGIIDVSGYIDDEIGNATAQTWFGLSDTDWDEKSNWTSEVPGIYTPVTIEYHSNCPISDKQITVGSLLIKSGVSVIVHGGLKVLRDLTIEEGCQITIEGDLSVKGSIVIENTSDKPSSLIVDGDVKGEATINWKSIETSRWWYMGHSLSGGTVNDNGTYYVYTYDNKNFGWSKKSETYAATPVEGLAMYIGAGTEYSYSGSLNHGDYAFTPKSIAYQVVANPYPSYIDFKSAYNNSKDISSTYQVYTTYKGKRAYATYNASNDVVANGGSQYIAPGQSFWIEATATTTDALKFSNGDRVHKGTVGLKSASVSSDSDEIRLVLKNSNTNDETVVLFRDYGSSFMTKYDSKKRMVGGNSGNLYTIKNSEYAIINSLPTFQGEKIIPLGYKVSEDGLADFTIQVNDLSNFEPTASVYLEDLDEGVTVNLREDREYTFTPTVAQSDDRFEIRVVPSVATDIDEEPVVSDRNVLIYTVGQLATVKVTEDVLAKDNKKVEVYNVAGQLVKQEVLNDAETSISLPQQNAMYIVKVSAEGYSYQQKVIAQ